jgi:septum formation protein
MRIILASQSPRRHELLKRVVPEFEIQVANIDEDALTVSDPYETAMKLAELKAAAVLTLNPDAIVIGSDTVVALETEAGWVQYSKPTNPDDAFRILSTLRGRTHSVITGVAVLSASRREVFFDEAKVTFHPVTDSQIWEYIETGEPMDKAGAYGAQGMGSFLVANLDGSFDTVVGLPVEKLCVVLSESIKR